MNNNLDILLTITCFLLRNYVLSIFSQLSRCLVIQMGPVPIYPDNWSSTILLFVIISHVHELVCLNVEAV